MNLRTVLTSVSLLVFPSIVSFYKDHSALADELIVRTKEGSVLKDPKSKIEIKRLKKGEKLELIEKSGSFWKVKVDGGTEGYISGIQVKRVESKDGASADPYKTSPDSQKGQTSSRTRKNNAVMGIRGLDDGSTKTDAAAAKPDLKKVKSMEEKPVDPSAVSDIESGLESELNEQK